MPRQSLLEDKPQTPTTDKETNKTDSTQNRLIAYGAEASNVTEISGAEWQAKIRQ